MELAGAEAALPEPGPQRSRGLTNQPSHICTEGGLSPAQGSL